MMRLVNHDRIDKGWDASIHRKRKLRRCREEEEKKRRKERVGVFIFSRTALIVCAGAHFFLIWKVARSLYSYKIVVGLLPRYMSHVTILASTVRTPLSY